MAFLESDCNVVTLNLFGLKIRLSRSKCWDSDPGPYGMFDLLKAYARIPYWFRGVNVQHGWNAEEDAIPSDIDKAKKLMLCLSARDKERFSLVSPVRCEVAGSPFVHYRRAHNIGISDDASGTIAYPAHSVRELRTHFDVDAYCDELLSLPQKFHPITVCLHPSDIEHHQLDKLFHERGIKTVCAGLITSRPFYEVFYELLRQHRYATSNEPGSYLFYAVEMGIPFFIRGEMACRDNSTSVIADIPAQKYFITDGKYGKLAYDLFHGGEEGEISEEQRKYVFSELGVEDCLSPAELNDALWQVAISQYYKPNLLHYLGIALLTTLRYPLGLFKHPVFFWRLWRKGTEALSRWEA